MVEVKAKVDCLNCEDYEKYCKYLYCCVVADDGTQYCPAIQRHYNAKTKEIIDGGTQEGWCNW